MGEEDRLEQGFVPASLHISRPCGMVSNAGQHQPVQGSGWVGRRWKAGIMMWERKGGGGFRGGQAGCMRWGWDPEVVLDPSPVPEAAQSSLKLFSSATSGGGTDPGIPILATSMLPSVSGKVSSWLTCSSVSLDFVQTYQTFPF